MINFATRSDYRYEIREIEVLELPAHLKAPARVKHDFFEIVRDRIIAEAWYNWNGASYIIDTLMNFHSSLFHDIIYQAIKEGLLAPEHRKWGDQVYRYVAMQHGMPRWLANTEYAALRLFGRHASGQSFFPPIKIKWK